MRVADALDEFEYRQRFEVELHVWLIDTPSLKVRPQLLVSVTLAVLEHRIQSISKVVVSAILRDTNLMSVEMQRPKRRDRLGGPPPVHKVKYICLKPLARDFL